MITRPAVLAIALLTVTLLFAACATTPDELRSNPGGKLTLSVKRPYQQVYQAVAERTRQCFLGDSHAYVSGDILTESRTARVTARINALNGGVTTLWMVEVKSDGADATRLDVYYHYRWMSRIAAMVEDWAYERTYDCRAPQEYEITNPI